MTAFRGWKPISTLLCMLTDPRNIEWCCSLSFLWKTIGVVCGSAFEAEMLAIQWAIEIAAGRNWCMSCGLQRILVDTRYGILKIRRSLLVLTGF